MRHREKKHWTRSSPSVCLWCLPAVCAPPNLTQPPSQPFPPTRGPAPWFTPSSFRFTRSPCLYNYSIIISFPFKFFNEKAWDHVYINPFESIQCISFRSTVPRIIKYTTATSFQLCFSFCLISFESNLKPSPFVSYSFIVLLSKAWLPLNLITLRQRKKMLYGDTTWRGS